MNLGGSLDKLVMSVDNTLFTKDTVERRIKRLVCIIQRACERREWGNIYSKISQFIGP